MPRFHYRAKKGPRQTVEGVLEAESRNAAVARLTAMALYPLEVEQRREAGRRRGRVSGADLALFQRQLADLLDGGLPLLRALQVLRQQSTHRMAEILSALVEDVKTGTGLSVAMGKFPDVFDAVTVNVVHAGETAGILDAVLSRMADFSDKEQEIRSKVRAALSYPLFLCAMGLLTVVALLVFVIPKLVPVFDEIGQALPAPTELLLGVSYFVRDYWWVLAGMLLLGFFLLRRFLSTAEGRRSFDQWRLRLPLLGTLWQKADVSRFSRTLAALLANGVPMLHAMQISARGIRNTVLRESLEGLSENVAHGEHLGDCMQRAGIFPPFAVNMVVVGEQSGQLERALDKVATAYERDVDRAIKFTTSLLEPAMILLMGGLVGFIVMAMLLPIFSINLVAQ